MKREAKRYIPIAFYVAASLFVTTSLCLLLCVISSDTADFLSDTVCYAVRRAMAFLTSLLPFSLFEAVLYLAPTLVLFAVLLGVRRLGDKRRTVRFLSGLLSIVLVLSSLYTLTLGISYRTGRLDGKLSLKTTPVTAETLYRTASSLLDTLSPLLEQIEYDEAGSSVMPYTLDALSEELSAAYDEVEERFGIVNNFSTRAKPIYASVAMSHLELLGIYSFFTGEANVNVDYPDYNLPFTVAHEFAHQRGIAREDEANFVAFLACMSSQDPFIRYSGCLNLYTYLANALYRTDKELYKTLTASLDARLLGELRAEAAHDAKYDIEFIGNVSNTLNDTYLKLNGTEGTVSYGLVVRLAVSYLLSEGT